MALDLGNSLTHELRSTPFVWLPGCGPQDLPQPNWLQVEKVGLERLGITRDSPHRIPGSLALIRNLEELFDPKSSSPFKDSLFHAAHQRIAQKCVEIARKQIWEDLDSRASETGDSLAAVYKQAAEASSQIPCLQAWRPLETATFNGGLCRGITTFLLERISDPMKSKSPETLFQISQEDLIQILRFQIMEHLRSNCASLNSSSLPDTTKASLLHMRHLLAKRLWFPLSDSVKDVSIPLPAQLSSTASRVSTIFSWGISFSSYWLGCKLLLPKLGAWTQGKISRFFQWGIIPLLVLPKIANYIQDKLVHSKLLDSFKTVPGVAGVGFFDSEKEKASSSGSIPGSIIGSACSTRLGDSSLYQKIVEKIGSCRSQRISGWATTKNHIFWLHLEDKDKGPFFIGETGTLHGGIHTFQTKEAFFDHLQKIFAFCYHLRPSVANASDPERFVHGLFLFENGHSV